MGFCRRIARQLLFERRKTDKRHTKEILKGCVHNLFKGSLQKILLSAAGLTMLVSPLLAASKSTITNLGNQTTIKYDESTKTHTITTSAIKGTNAFNAFQDFTLQSGEIAKLHFPGNTTNLLNFVKNKIDIKGTLNAIRDNKIGGNLYFLSSEGFILDEGGVINAGAFYAMTPTKGFMDKFIGKDKLNLSRVDDEINYILNRQICNYNCSYDHGVTINPYGEIEIKGKINTLNGIGLYAGGIEEKKDNGITTFTNGKGIVTKSSASLNTLSIEDFKSVVNLSGTNYEIADTLDADGGNIELISVQDNTHQDSKFFEYLSGYTSFKAAQANALIETDATINSRKDVNIISYASNGRVNWIKKDGDDEIKEFEQIANIADIKSTVTIGGSINSKSGSINISAISDNINELKTPNFSALALEFLGSSVYGFPLNIDANVLKSSTTSNVTVKSNVTIEADKYISIAAQTNSSSVAGASTAKFVTDKAANSKFSFLPVLSSAVNISESSSKVDFDGTAISHLETEEEIKDDKGKVIDTKKSISIHSESNSSLAVNSKSKSSNSKAWGGAAVSVGKNKNTAELTIGANANFKAKKSIDLSSVTNSDNSVTAECELKETGYAVPVVAVSLFDSDATANIQGNINADNQVGTFSINVNNNINSDEISAESGLQSSPWDWEAAAAKIKKQSINKLFDDLALNRFTSQSIPNSEVAKFGIAATVAYGSGKHNASINIKPNAKITTAGKLELSSLTYVNDTTYDSTADIYCCEEHEGTLFQSSIAFLYNDFDYSSNIIIDDSEKESKTIISGNEVSIESKVYQPYRRPKAMWDEVLGAVKKLKDYFSKSEHADTINRIAESFKNFNDLVVDPSHLGSAGNSQQFKQKWREFTDIVDSLINFVKKEGILTSDGFAGRTINLLKKLLEFKEYSNYLNYSVSSSVNTTETGNNQPFSISGSIYVGNNSSKSNFLIGKNATINATTTANVSNISLSSISDVTTAAMVGGLPVLYQNNQGKNSIGGSVLVHKNSSEANLLAASGASIGSDTVGNLNIITRNNFTPIDITMGTSSVTNGLNGMASAIVGSSSSNIRIDDGTNLGGKNLNIYAYNTTNADNIVGAFTLSEKKGLGVGLAITILDKENQVLVQDNDEYWQNKRKELGLRSNEPVSSEYKYETATITADVFNVVAKTTGTINTIGVAGSVAVDDKSKYDKFTDKANYFNDLVSGTGIDTGTSAAKYWALGKICDLDILKNRVDNNFNPDQGSNPGSNPDPNTDPNQELNNFDNLGQGSGSGESGAANAELSLTLNGSAAANSINNKTKAVIDTTNIVFIKDAASASLNLSAINSTHTLSFSGAAGIMAQGGNASGVSVGLDGSVAVNKIVNTTEALINKTKIKEAKQINSFAINGGESIATGLGLQVIASSHDSERTGSGAVNASINLINNNVSSKVNNATFTANVSSNKTNMAVTAYESDTQVTGGVSAAVGKQKGAVGVSIDIAKINNRLEAEIDGGTYANMKNVEVNALQASTIVNAGIAAAVSAGVDQGSFAVSGSGVYSNLTNTSDANIKNANITGDVVKVRARDVRTSVEGVKVYEDNIERNGKKVDFISKDGKDFYTGLETATGTTELGELSAKRNGSLLVTAAISGAYGGTAAGLGAAINQTCNTFNINIENSNISSKEIKAEAVSNTVAVALGVGAAVSSEQNKGSGIGSAAWNSILNSSNITFSNNTLKSDTLSLDSLNKTTTVGLGGAISVSPGGAAAIGASVAYNAINNNANSELYGGSVTGISSDTSKLSVKAENSSNIWGISLSVGVSEKVAVGGTVTVNGIKNNATAAVGSSTTKLPTNISNLNEFNVSAKDSADIKALSGAVTVSKKVAVGGAVTVNHINGETSSTLDNVNFDAITTNFNAESKSNNLSLATGLGGAGTVAFDGAAVNNDISRDVKTTIASSTIDNATATFNTSATAIGNTGSLAAVVCGSKQVSVGAGISVNRMGGDVKTSLNKNNFKVKNLFANAFSNQEITTIGVAGSAAGVSVSGSIAYNSIKYDTIAEAIDNTLLSAENNLVIRAVSDDILKNYAGLLNVGIGIPTPEVGTEDLSGGLDNLPVNQDSQPPQLEEGSDTESSNLTYEDLFFDYTTDENPDENPAVNPAVNPVANRNRFRESFNGYASSLKGAHDKMGTVSGKDGGVGVGVSVSVNKIDGKTIAKISGGKVTAFGKDSNDKVKLNNSVNNEDINHKYADSSTISINSSLAGKRQEETKTGLIVDSSSTHTAKSFIASVGGGSKVGVNANVNVNLIGGESNAILENATVNEKKDEDSLGDVSVKASDFTNTAGFIGNVSFGGNAGIGASADTNKVVRKISAKVDGVKEKSTAKNLEIKANSKQGISSVVAGLGASKQVAVAGNIDVALLNSTTEALLNNSIISVNSLDIEANHYARAHEIALSVGIGAGTAGVGASVVVNNDINTVTAEISSSTIGINSGKVGAVKVNSVNDDDFETITGAGGGGVYAGVAGAVAVNYMNNSVETNIASTTIGTSANRADSVEIKAKDVSAQVSKGGTGAVGGYAGVGAVVEVNTLDGQTNTKIKDSKIYADNDVNLGSSEERNSEQFAVSVSAGLAGVGANVLVINSGKKLNLNDSGSTDANNDTYKALGMADEAVSTDFKFDNNNTFSDDELKTIFGGTPTYIASENGKAVTLTKIDKSIIDSKSGRISSYNTASGSLSLSNNGGAGGAGAVLGCFGYIYDNKNVVTSITNSHFNAGNGINIKNITGGKSKLSLIDAVAGIGDYAGAFGYVNLAGNTSVGIAGSRLINNKDSINIYSVDEAAAEADSRGYTFGGVGIGTIIAKAKNNSLSDVTISNSRIANNGNYIASNTIFISSEKNNSLSAIGYSGTVSAVNVSVVSTLAQDNGTSTVKLDTGNYFVADDLNILASNRPKLNSKFYSWSAGIALGVGVGDVTTREYGISRLIANKGNNYKAKSVNLGAAFDSQSSQISEAYTVTLGVDGHDNKADTLSSSNVAVDVNIGKDDFDKDTILNVYGENKASATIDVYGVGVGGVLSVANNSAKAIASLTTNVNVVGEGKSSLSEINVHSSSEAVHNLYANGDGGGLINISPHAASTVSTINLNTNTNLSKELFADKVTANAIGIAKGYQTSDAVQGELVGGCGTRVLWNYDVKSNVNLKDDSKINANIVELKANNGLYIGSYNPKNKSSLNNKTNYSKSYGLITGSSVKSEDIIGSTAQVKIGKNASIIASKQINIDAKTKVDLINSVHSGGAGLANHPGSTSKNTLTIYNNIITDEGSLLKTDQVYADINLGTSYDIIGSFSAYTEVEGAGAGSTEARVINDITSNNKIDISGDIFSYNDINLYTDKDSNGILANYNIYNDAQVYTRAIIPWKTKAEIKNDIKRDNTLNINSKANLKSIRHTTLSAKDISFSLKNFIKEFNWYKQNKDGKTEDVSTVSNGNSNNIVKDVNSVNVNGNVTAGINNKINVKIDGKVAFDKNISGDGIVHEPVFSCNIKGYEKGIKTGTMNYGNELFKRYQEVEKLYKEYSSSQIGLNYKAEMDRLLLEMEKYGLYDSSKKQIVSNMSVDYVELPDMVSSGGNIYINANSKDSVTGNGSLKAKGAPQIKVENNSNLYMKVNDLIVVEPGGDIIFNDKSLGNSAKTELSKVKRVETDNSTDSLIEVKENWKSRYDVNYKDPADGKTKSDTVNPLTNIEINGHIINEYGSVVFYNANKDIVLQGKSAKDSASINGASISISAPKGSIAQGYTEGITNIGYTPEAVLKDYAKEQENSIISGLDLGNNHTKTKQNTLSEDKIQEYVKKYQKSTSGKNDSASGVWLAGGSVYLNGEIININGTIQSGYAKFEVVLSDEEKKKIQSIKDNYDNAGKPQVTEAYLEQKCKINDSGMKWYKDGKTGVEAYKYIVQAFYNPQTDTIVLEDVESSGGQIYITGKIVNTSGGKIYAADGSSDIDITNNTGYKLIANTLDAGDQKGFISIMDLAKSDEKKGILATLTEMTSDSTKVWEVTKNGTDKDNPLSSTGLSQFYNPKEGLTYNWSTGYKETYEYRYDESYDFTVWGLFDYNSTCSTNMMKKIEDGSLSPSSKGKNDKLTGSNIESPIVSADNGYSLYFKNDSQYKYGPSSGGYTKYNSFLHFSGTHYSWAEYKYGSTRDYQHSIKADYPIAISFLKGNGDINLSTNSDLLLNSDIISKYGNIKLTSSNGSIEQHGGKIYSDNIWLNATTGIGSKNAITQKMQSDKGILSAVTKSGDVNLVSHNYGSLKDTNLKLTAVTDKGDTKVTADASLLQGGQALDVKGNKIDLVSNLGSIGKNGALLKIQAGQEITKPGDTLSASVNAKAQGDVALNQTSGDMRLGKIVSQKGDVYLTSAGSVLDALPPGATENVNQSAEQLIARWKELGIISDSGKDNSAEKRQEALTAYKNSVYTAYNRYTDLKKRFSNKGNDTNSDTYKEYLNLKERFGSYSSADKWLDAQIKDKNSQWYKLQNEVVYGWTQDALLYAIQESILNREEGSTIVPKSPEDANIKARNIYINAGGGIGRDEGYSVVDISNLQSKDGLKALKAIAAAEASDVKWGYDGDKVDKNKATINKVNSLKIDASGSLKAEAKGNIYFEEVNEKPIKLDSVSSTDGNVRIYGSKGIYNATSYKEGAKNNVINLAGKDLIIESGDGSIGTKIVPVTTNMSGFITARSNDLINLYQIGNNAITFAAVYSGSYINIRALKDILSVYSGIQAEELGYINAKGDITLYSDEGNIGQPNGKGLRVKLAKDKKVNAEADSVYLKAFSDDSQFNLGKITARKGNIGIEAKSLDIVLKNDIKAQNLEFTVRSLKQNNGSVYVSKLLKVIADNGIFLHTYYKDKDNKFLFYNNIAQASLVNNKSGDILLYNNRDLTLFTAINKADDGKFRILNRGSVTAKNGLSSNGRLFVWANGNIDIEKDSSSKDWMYLLADNGHVEAENLTADSLEVSADNGLTVGNVTANKYIDADVKSGNILTGDLISDNDSISIVTSDGNINSKKVLAKGDVALIANYDQNSNLINGELSADSITSSEGNIEAIGYKSLVVEFIKAADNFLVGSNGNVKILNLLSGIKKDTISINPENLTIKENTSYLLGKNINIDNINVDKSFEAYASGKFNVNKIVVNENTDIVAHNDINIKTLKSGEQLNIASHEDGNIKINNITVDNGILNISNETGNIELEKVTTGNDVVLTNCVQGDVLIKDSIVTNNGGSLFGNSENGEFSIKSGEISGDASIYSEKGSIVLTKINVGKELDVRTKDGSIVVGLKTTIGGDATLQSDTDNVVLADAVVGGNMKVNSQKYAVIASATVGGSMLMKGDETGVIAKSLNVGKDLILNTHAGSIKVDNAVAGENSYIAIDGNGGNIEIKNIKTGKDLKGNLIVVSHSNLEDNKYIDIKNAVAANKVIINSKSNIKLNEAYALNGKLEVKAAGDIVAELIKVAKETYIASLAGLIDITKVISGDSIKIVNILGDKTEIDDIQTLNPDSDISISALFSGLNLKNASTTRDIEFKTLMGDVYIEKVYAGKNLIIDSLESNININNTNVNKDVILDGGIGNIDIVNTSIGNDLKAVLNGTMNLIDSIVANNASITSKDNSIININKFKSNGFNLEDKGKTNFTINDSEIKNFNAQITGEANITNFTSDSMSATLSGNSTILDSKLGKADITNNGTLLIEASEGNSIKTTNNKTLTINKDSFESLNLTNNNQALVEDSAIDSMTSVNNKNGKLELTKNLTLGSFDLTNKGNALIHNSIINSMTSSNEGKLELTAAPVYSLDITNKAGGNAIIHDTTVTTMTSSNEGILEITNAPIDTLDLSNRAKGEVSIHDTTVKTMTATNDGKLKMANALSESMNLTNQSNGEVSILDAKVNSMVAVNYGELKVNNLTGVKFELSGNGNINIEDSNINNINANVGGNTTINNLSNNRMTFNNSGVTNINNSSTDKFDLTNTGKATIKESNVKTMSAANEGKFELTNTPVDKLDLTNNSNGLTSIHDTSAKSINALNDGELNVNKLTGDKLVLSAGGNTNIDNSKVTSIKANNSGNLSINKIDSEKTDLTSSGNANIKDSDITNVNANISGNVTINNLSNSLMFIANSGNTNISNSSTSKINLTNTGKTNLKNLEVKNTGYLVNKKGNMNIANLDAANSFDVDSNGGSINMSGIDIKKDFNFALAGNSGVKFTDITIGNDFNVYAGKAVLNGSSLDVGNNLNTYTYSRYSSPKASMRAAVKSSSGTAKSSESEEGFTLILDQLNIGGGLYVDNPDVTIKVKESTVGKDVDIDAGKENIQIDKLDVDGGNLDIKGNTGSVKLGDVNVDNFTSINLKSGNLEVSDLSSKLDVDFKVGGNITSDKSVETETGSVNMIAGGNVNAYKVLAKQQGNIEAVNGDIIIGQIDGKTLVFKEDANDRNLRVGEANVETRIIAGADYIDIDLINQTANSERLAIDFTHVNGRAMDNVVIRDIKTDTGVNMFNLVSMYGNIHVSNDIFNLTKTYLLKNGDLSNTKLRFRLYGDNPIYSRDVDIIAFFAPMINHRSFADISFTNEWHPQRQDYYPLTAKGDYRHMFNQYTVVEDFETLRLAYEERVEVINNWVIGKFDNRKPNNSKAFYVDYGTEISTDGESINLEEVGISAGLEYDSASGELKAVGSQVKPQRAVD